MRRICGHCKKYFHSKSPTHKYCGRQSLKGSCAHQVALIRMKEDNKKPKSERRGIYSADDEARNSGYF